MDFLWVLFALIYRFFYKMNRFVFLRPQKPLQKSKLIIIGSYLMGGAGKTPFTLYLAKSFLKENFTVAILCHSKAMDEYEWLQQEALDAKVFSTKNRFRLAKKIDGLFDIIIADDGFEDFRLSAHHKIALQWGEFAHDITDLFPSGYCRSLKKDHPDVTMTLYCGNSFIDPDLVFSISEIKNEQGDSLNKSATAMCGIGNPDRFFSDLQDFGITIEKKIIRPDHDRKFELMLKKELLLGKPIVITEKDCCRLTLETRKTPLVFVAKQKLSVLHDFKL